MREGSEKSTPASLEALSAIREVDDDAEDDAKEVEEEEEEEDRGEKEEVMLSMSPSPGSE